MNWILIEWLHVNEFVVSLSDIEDDFADVSEDITSQLMRRNVPIHTEQDSNALPELQ